MRYRLGRLDDIARCRKIFLDEGAIPVSSEVASVLPELWQDTLAGGRFASFTVIEEDAGAGYETCAFGMSAFVSAETHAELRARREPHLDAWLYEELASGRQPL